MSAQHTHARRPGTATTPEAGAGPVPIAAFSPAPVAGLTVGRFDDPAEHAADVRAGSMRSHASSRQPRADVPVVPVVATPPDPLGHLRRTPVSAPAARVGAAGGVLDALTTSRIDALRRSGSPLADPVRQRMEGAFGTSLGHVRVHSGAESARLNADLSAEAFTSGNDIFFGGSGLDPAQPAE